MYYSTLTYAKLYFTTENTSILLRKKNTKESLTKKNMNKTCTCNSINIECWLQREKNLTQNRSFPPFVDARPFMNIERNDFQLRNQVWPSPLRTTKINFTIEKPSERKNVAKNGNRREKISSEQTLSRTNALALDY